MPTDYVLFNHGVNTREARPQYSYANTLFELMEKHYNLRPQRELKKIPLYWGDVNEVQEQMLLDEYQRSSVWNKLWFKDFRATQILQFVGDTALYVSRSCGAKVVDALAQQILTALQSSNPEEDRLHIVTHSLGTVILFDILFSARWDPPAPGSAGVQAIRNKFFGLAPNPEHGIRLGSITTMGSPLGFFTLMSVNAPPQDTKDANGNIISTHDITPRLETLLGSLYQELGQRLPWYNFIHPGDPIAYPVEKVLPAMVDGKSRYLDIQDILISLTNLIDLISEPVSQTLLALLHGGEAHNSYWSSDQVADMIVQAIGSAAAVNSAAQNGSAAAVGSAGGNGSVATM